MESIDLDAALEVVRKFPNAVLEVPHRGDSPIEYFVSTTEHAHASRTLEYAVCNSHAGNLFAFTVGEHLENVGMAGNDDLTFGFEQTACGVFNFVNQVVDDVVGADCHTFGVGMFASTGFNICFESHDHRVRGRCEQYVGFVDRTRRCGQHPDLDLVVRDLLNSSSHGIDRSVVPGLDNHQQLFCIRELNTAHHLCHGRSGPGRFAFGSESLTSGDQVTAFTVTSHNVELVTCGRGAIEAKYLDWSRRASLGNYISEPVYHRLNASAVCAGNNIIAGADNPRPDQHRGD